MGTPYLTLPFQTAVDVDFNKGNTLISFIGDIPENAERFQIRLEAANSDNIGLFFEPNVEAGVIIRKALKAGEWSEEEKAGPCTLKAGGPFEILILIEKQEYDIAVNGERFTQFQHRIPPNQIKKIVVEGDVNLVGINLFHESSDDFEGNPNVHSSQASQQGSAPGGEETIIPKNAIKNKAEYGNDDYYGGGGGGSKPSAEGGYKPSGGYGDGDSEKGGYQPSGGYGGENSGKGDYQPSGGYGGEDSGKGGYQPSGGYGNEPSGGYGNEPSGGGDYGAFGGGQAQTFPGRKSKFDFAQGSGLIGAAATAIGAYAINKYLNRPQGGGMGMGGGGMGGMGGGGMGGMGGGGMGGMGGGGGGLANMILGAVGSAAGSHMGYNMTNQIPGMNTLQKHGIPTGMIGSLIGSVMGSKMVRGNR